MTQRVYSKYGARKTVVDGIAFASKREAERYRELMLMQAGGGIKELSCQVSYPLAVNGQKVATYIADFVYWPTNGVQPTIEDAKGFRTPVYRLKKRMFEAQYKPWTIQEV